MLRTCTHNMLRPKPSSSTDLMLSLFCMEALQRCVASPCKSGQTHPLRLQLVVLWGSTQVEQECRPWGGTRPGTSPET